MTKTTILGVATVTGVVVVSVPIGILLSNKEYPPESIIWPGRVIPKLSSARNIRDKHPQVTCLNEHYGVKIVWNLEVIYRDSNFDDVKDFSTNSKSCLLVEYYRQNYEGDKWWGEFRLIWSVKDDTQGLITVTNVRTDNGKLKGNSAAYTLKPNNDSRNSWSATRQNEITERDKTKEALERLIPKFSSNLLTSSDSDSYWGFNQNLQKICRKNECKKIKGEKIYNSYSWDFVSDGSDEIYSWASDIDTWLDKIFAWKKIKNKIKDVKGKWQSK